MAETRDGRAVTLEDLRVAGAMTVLLRDAIKPNLVQTVEGGPAFVHAGPFANIAHGNSSVVADRVALKLNEVVCTEGGFASDMGLQKFMDIKCRLSGLRPSAAVIVATIRALKMHGGVGTVVAGQPLDPALLEEDPEAVRRGAENLAQHIAIVANYAVPAVVAINTFPTDHESEFEAAREVALAAGAEDVVVSRHFSEGGDGALDLARAVWAAAQKGAPDFRLPVARGRLAARADRGHRHARLRRGRRGLRATGGGVPGRHRAPGLRRRAGLHGQDAVVAEPRPGAQGTAARLAAAHPGRSSLRRGRLRDGLLRRT